MQQLLLVGVHPHPRSQHMLVSPAPWDKLAPQLEGRKVEWLGPCINSRLNQSLQKFENKIQGSTLSQSLQNFEIEQIQTTLLHLSSPRDRVRQVCLKFHRPGNPKPSWSELVREGSKISKCYSFILWVGTERFGISFSWEWVGGWVRGKWKFHRYKTRLLTLLSSQQQDVLPPRTFQGQPKSGWLV